VCDGWAADGYRAVAPDLWSRVSPGLTLPYDDEGSRIGKKMSAETDWERVLDDLQVTADAVRGAGRVAIVGFCYGGTLAWLAACRRSLDAAVPYYGSDMCDYQDEPPRCPVLCHVGDKDTAVPPHEVAAFRAKRPEPVWHIYPGVLHGFDNFTRPVRYNEAASRLARRRTLGFLRTHIG
jgi:carboxymethylenebutenolidase